MSAARTDYAGEKAVQIREATQKIIGTLPNDVFDYILALSESTQPMTRYAYATDLKLFINYLQRENPKFSKDLIAWTSKDFENVSVKDINMYLDYLTVYFNDNDVMVTNQELGKQRKFYSIRSFYKWLYKQQKIKSDVTALVDSPKRHEKPIIRLDQNEVNKILTLAETGDKMTAVQQKYHELTMLRDKAMLSLFLGTGIRVSECVGMNIDDINLDEACFLVTRKGGNQVILYLPDEIIPALKDYIEQRKHTEALQGHENALFLSLQKRRMTVRAVENMVKKYAKIAAPLKNRISPHKLRSTFGTNLYNETGDIYLVADVLGHSDINTTRRHYAAMNDERRRFAATKVKLTNEDSENMTEEKE